MWFRRFFLKSVRFIVEVPRKPIRPVRAPRPAVERLEDRTVPANVLANPGLGPILPNVQLQAVYYSDLSSTPASDQLNSAARAKIDAYLAYLASSASGFLEQLTQYQPNAKSQVIGAGTAKSGASNGVTPGGAHDTGTYATSFGFSAFRGPVVYDNAKQGDVPANTPSGDVVQSMLTSLVNSGGSSFLKLDSNGNNETEFVVYVPYGVVVDAGGGANSLNAFAGYHYYFPYTAAGGGTNSTYVGHQNIYYAVIPYPTANPYQDGGTQLGYLLTSFQEQTIVNSHEVAECVSDPTIQSWLYEGEEVADMEAWNYMTVKNPATGTQYAIQNIWSNSGNGGLGGASGPAPSQDGSSWSGGSTGDMYINLFTNPIDDPNGTYRGVLGTMYYGGSNSATLDGTIFWGDGYYSDITFQQVGGNSSPWYNLISNGSYYTDPLGTPENQTVTVTDGANDAASADGFLDLGASITFPNMNAVPIGTSPIYTTATEPTVPTQTEGTPLTGTPLATFVDTSNLADNTVAYEKISLSWSDALGNHTINTSNVAVNPATDTYTLLAPSGLVFYGDQSSYNVSIRINDSSAYTLGAPIIQTINVNDPSPIVTAAGSFGFSAGVSTGTFTVATFTDPGQPVGQPVLDPSDYTANISWGNGNMTTATLANGGIVYNQTTGVFSIQGSTTYAQGTGATSSYTISVTLTYDETALAPVTDQVTVANEIATAITFTMQPGNTQAGSALDGSSGGVVVTAVDANGKPVLGNYTINIAVATGPGTFTSTSTTSVTITNGSSATFSNLVLNLAGSYTLQASTSLSGNNVSVTSSSFLVMPNQVVFSVSPPSKVASVASFGLTVLAEYADGSSAATYNGPLSLAIVSDTPQYAGEIGTAALGGTVAMNFTNGQAVFSGLTLNQLGTYTLEAATGTVTSSASNGITVVANQLVFTTVPANVQSGSAFQVVVKAEDELGNVDHSFGATVTLSTTAGDPPGGTLKENGSTTVTAVASQGVATFNKLTLDKIGSYTLQASATPAQGNITGLSSSIQVTGILAITIDPPGTVASGTGFGLTAQYEDSTGAPVNGFGGLITISIASDTPQYSGEIGTAALGGFVSMDAGNGVATFTSLNLNQLGTYTLQAATGTVTSSISTSVTVVANQLIFTTIPPSTPSGANFQVVVQAEDVLGNVDQNFGSTVTLTLSSNPAGGTLKENGSTTVTATASQGVATFNNLTLDKIGSYVLSASASPPQGTISGMSNTIQVTGFLTITTEPAGTVASGNAFGLTATYEDANGAPVPGFGGLITVSLVSDTPQYGGEVGTAALGGMVSMDAGSGVAMFTTLNLNQLGTYTLQASTGLVTTSASTSVTVVANQLVFTTIPSSVQSSRNFQVVVKAEDELGNVDQNFGSTVTLILKSNPPGGTLKENGSTTVTAAASQGVATFNNLTLDELGAYTLMASATPAQGNITGLSGSIQVGGNLVITAEPPGNVVSGGGFGLTVTDEDSLGNVDNTFKGQVTISIFSDSPQYSGEAGTAALGGFVNMFASGGVATFTNLNLNQLGTYTLQAASGTVTSAASSSIAIAANQLVFTTIPSSVQSAASFQVVVQAEDMLGNVDQNFGSTTSLSINSGPFGASLQINGPVTVSAGVVTFNNVSLNKAGLYTLSASASPALGTITGTSGQVEVTANQLVFSVEPTGAVASGAGFALTVQAEDSTGTVDPNFQGPVTLSIISDTTQYSGELGTAQLGGITNLSNGSGVFSFTNLTLNQLGTYRLEASSSGVASQPSTTITISANQLVFTMVPASVSSGSGFEVQVKAEDVLGNVDQNFGAAIALAIGNGPSGAVLAQNGTSPVPSVVPTAGVATFSNLTLDLIGTYKLAASAKPSTGALSQTSSSVTVTPLFTFINQTPPSTVKSGAAFSVQVGEFEVIGGQYVGLNVSGQVSLGVSGPGALRGTTTANFISGVASFNNVILDHFGNYNLTASVLGGPSVTSGTMTVTASSFKMISNSTVLGGTPTNIVFEALDDLGNVCTNFTGPISVSVSVPFRDSVNGSLTPTIANGVITFSNLIFSGAGSYVFTLIAGSASGTGTVTVAGGIVH